MFSQYMLRIFALLFLVESVFSDTKQEFSVEIITLGFIWPTSPSNLLFTGPAFQTGVSRIIRQYQNKFSVTQAFLYDRNVKNCLDLSAQSDELLGRYYYQRLSVPNMTVVIVPGCNDAAFTNRLVSQWNILYITSVYTDPIIRKKTQSPTWISTTPAAVTNFAVLYANLFQRYNWSTVYVIADEAANPFFTGLAKSIFADLKTKDRNQSTYRLINSAQEKNHTYLPVLEDFRRTSRICAFFGHGPQTKSLLMEAALVNMTDGDYIYIALDTFHNIKFGNFLWSEYNASQAPQVLSQALGSLLLISLANSVNRIKPEGKYLEEVWSRGTRDIWNFSNPDNEKATPYTFASHAAVEVFGQVLNETLSSDADFDPSDGVAFTKKFFHRRFETTVSDIYIDSVGEPRVNLVLKQFNRDSGTLTSIGIQYAHNASLSELAGIQWPNGRAPPRNEPYCGYIRQKTACNLNAGTSLAAYIAPTICATIVFLMGVSWTLRLISRRISSRVWWKLDHGYGEGRMELRGQIVFF